MNLITLQIFAGMEGDTARLVGTIDVEPFHYYADFANGLRSMANDIEALGRSEDPA
jgi:hypothetical protein